MNADFLDLLRAFVAADVRFLVVGAYAVAVHGHPRTTGDLDVWIDATPANAQRAYAALERFGAPLHELNVEELSRPGLVFQMGVPPVRIDVLTGISGIGFAEAWQGRLMQQIEGESIPFIGRDALIRNKRAAGRPQDLADVVALESLRTDV